MRGWPGVSLARAPARARRPDAGGAGRLPVHPPRLQRSGGARRLASRGARTSRRGGAQPILVQWTDLDDTGWHDALRPSPALVVTRLRERLPQRLAEQLLVESQVAVGAHARNACGARSAHALVERLCRYPLPWSGDEGYRKAEVTGGGVALGEVDPRTLESRRHRGLFFCGEMLDAFGPIGGHNFAWAWATGRLAGLAAARRGDDVRA